MKKLLVSILILINLTACSVPQVIKDADATATKSEIRYIKNMDILFSRTIEAYKLEAVAHITFRSEVARHKGHSEEEVKLFYTKNIKELKKIITKALSKYVEVRKDLQDSVELRLKISEYLESKADVKGIIKVIMKETGNE